MSFGGLQSCVVFLEIVLQGNTGRDTYLHLSVCSPWVLLGMVLYGIILLNISNFKMRSLAS